MHGFTIRFHLYTVPGQVLYERTRVAVLNGADGVVFVADGSRDRLPDNLQSLRELAQNLTAQGKRFHRLPAGDAIQQDGPAERRFRLRYSTATSTRSRFRASRQWRSTVVASSRHFARSPSWSSTSSKQDPKPCESLGPPFSVRTATLWRVAGSIWADM